MEVNWQPDATSKIPVYQQIINTCISHIQRGDWPINAQLPSQRQLASQFHVNRSTVAKAMTILLADGVLTTAFGGGTRIASNSWSTMMHQPVDWQDFIDSGEFVANQATIQRINKVETQARIRLSTGELGPDIFPVELMQHAMLQASTKLTSMNYLPPMGSLALRQIIAERLAKWDIQTSADSVLITSGSLQSLQLIAVSLLADGATVYTTPASYLKSLRVLQSVHAQFKSLPTDRQGLQYWHITAGEGQRLLYVIPTFDNPAGGVMSQQRRADLIQYAQERRLPIIEDSAYQDLWLDERPPQPLKALDKSGNVLYLGSISKSLAPGMRIGWIVGPQSIIKRLADVKMQTDYGASSVSQMVLTEVLNDPDYDRYLETVRQKLKLRRDSALSVLESELGQVATWQKPAGGFYIWLTLDPAVNVQQLFDQADQNGIVLNPGSVYGSGAQHNVRLSYAFETESQFAAGIKQISRFIRAQLSKE
ncbi:aminotransferase class I/II-fold pyridoxal phosphate-dependent enzyme [Lactobacillus sp. CRM56-3]|uniref:Aminotransferase class I/II-fold pyridoxal phosphate-dependent enzyme n=1 Tax=Secundilactobacillus folii TaxID=2678357 RepID=A0A7X2XWA5_9LACO|nr:aminotransferase class I/II-fold pyridoxal phosphate-dependent enzyme [Secundilactobacillus folii]